MRMDADMETERCRKESENGNLYAGENAGNR
jgi:hypothetical protein